MKCYRRIPLGREPMRPLRLESGALTSDTIRGASQSRQLRLLVTPGESGARDTSALVAVEERASLQVDGLEDVGFRQNTPRCRLPELVGTVGVYLQN